MRQLIRERPGVILAYLLIVAVGALGSWQSKRVSDEAHRKVIRVACAVTAPIPLPTNDPRAVVRTKTRNAQLEAERRQLIGDHKC